MKSRETWAECPLQAPDNMQHGSQESAHSEIETGAYWEPVSSELVAGHGQAFRARLRHHEGVLELGDA